MSIFDDPDIKAYLKHFEEHGLPGMKSSAFALAILDPEPNAALCLEVGAAVLLDKPIIITVKRGTPIPANIKRVATTIVEVDDFKADTTRIKLKHAIESLMANDIRVRKFKGTQG